MAGDANPPPELIWLYQRALICRVFPAYKLEDLEQGPVVDILQAVELLDLAKQVAE